MKNTHIFKVGDAIVVDNELHTKVTNVDGDKVWFLDEDGAKWHLTKDDYGFIQLDNDEQK